MIEFNRNHLQRPRPPRLSTRSGLLFRSFLKFGACIPIPIIPGIIVIVGPSAGIPIAVVGCGAGTGKGSLGKVFLACSNLTCLAVFLA